MIVVDGSHLAHRVLRSDDTGKIDHLAGIQTFITTLGSVCRKRKNQHGVIIGWDRGVPIHRRELLTEYKPSKKPVGDVDDALYSSINKGESDVEITEDELEYTALYTKVVETLHKKILPLLGCISIRLPNVEADDILSLWCSTVVDEHKVILSSDRDLLQLLDDNTEFYDALNKKTITIDDLIELGYTCDDWRSQWLYAKAITGDTSDNIVGIRDVGGKIAIKYAEQLMGHLSQGMDLATACLLLDRPPRGRKTGLENIRVGSEIIKTNYDLMDLSYPIKHDIEMTQQIRSAILGSKIVRADEDQVMRYLDSLRLRECKVNALDILEANINEDLEHFLPRFLK